MDKMKIKVIRGTDLRCGVPTYAGSMSAEVLIELHDIPRRDSTKDTGYQRNAKASRVNSFARDFQGGKADIPTSVLLNVRENILGFVKEDNGVATMDLNVLKQKKEKIRVVDGQHRLLALKEAFEKGTSFPNFKLHFVCMVGADEIEEMRQFYVVNKEAKSVQTDLAYSLLRKQVEVMKQFGKNSTNLKNSIALMDDLTRKGEMWKVDGDRLAHQCNKSSPIWRGRIRLPNEEKGTSTVPSASFVKSLKPAFNSALFKTITDEQRLQLITVYWEAIKEILGNHVFEDISRDDSSQDESPQKDSSVQAGNDETETSYKDYSIQKGIGVQVMHGILPTIIEYVRNGSSLFDRSAYVKVMRPALENLRGINGEGEDVEGKNFWRTGQAGAVGQFSSEAGKKQLVERIRSELPEFDLEI